MKAYELQGPGGIDAMMLVDKPVPVPGPGQVLVKLKAATINYRDLLTVKGGYGSRQKFPLIPLSDGAGVVEAVGAGVSRIQAWRSGDRQFLRGLARRRTKSKPRCARRSAARSTACCANTGCGRQQRWCARRII